MNRMRKHLAGLALMTCVGAPLSCVAAAAQPAPAATSSTKTVVLVHGFFADGSGWLDVIKRLQAAHINVVSVQNPLASLEGDVEATKLVIDRQPGQVVLVGHSYGGFVITHAGNDPKVVSLVYVAAFAPDIGDSVNSLLSGYPAPPWAADLVADAAGNLTMTEPDYVRYFAADLPLRQSQSLYAAQVAPAGSLFAQTATTAAWQALPSWYVLTEDDEMIPPDLQRSMSSRIGAKVTQVKSSHSVMISHPDLVAGVIIAAFRQP